MTMILCIQNVLSGSEIGNLRQDIEQLTFIDGRKTAGWAARLVKDNEQADSSDGRLEAVRQRLTDRIADNELFQLAAKPKELTPIMISRYNPGNEYGSHVDDAIMQGMRSDLSFTLFLSDPTAYIGGELIIETTAGEQSFKLPEGAMVVYPSTTLHRVATVQEGVRIAAVGWVRSFIRSPEHREILFDLELARRELFALTGKTPTFDKLSKCHANLLRMWAED
jgi:PKHD-type hydroxylase